MTEQKAWTPKVGERVHIRYNAVFGRPIIESNFEIAGRVGMVVNIDTGKNGSCYTVFADGIWEYEFFTLDELEPVP